MCTPSGWKSARASASTLKRAVARRAASVSATGGRAAPPAAGRSASGEDPRRCRGCCVRSARTSPPVAGNATAPGSTRRTCTPGACVRTMRPFTRCAPAASSSGRPMAAAVPRASRASGRSKDGELRPAAFRACPAQRSRAGRPRRGPTRRAALHVTRRARRAGAPAALPPAAGPAPGRSEISCTDARARAGLDGGEKPVRPAAPRRVAIAPRVGQHRRWSRSGRIGTHPGVGSQRPGAARGRRGPRRSACTAQPRLLSARAPAGRCRVNSPAPSMAAARWNCRPRPRRRAAGTPAAAGERRVPATAGGHGRSVPPPERRRLAAGVPGTDAARVDFRRAQGNSRQTERHVRPGVGKGLPPPAPPPRAPAGARPARGPASRRSAPAAARPARRRVFRIGRGRVVGVGVAQQGEQLVAAQGDRARIMRQDRVRGRPPAPRARAARKARRRRGVAGRIGRGRRVAAGSAGCLAPRAATAGEQEGRTRGHAPNRGRDFMPGKGSGDGVRTGARAIRASRRRVGGRLRRHGWRTVRAISRRVHASTGARRR